MRFKLKKFMIMMVLLFPQDLDYQKMLASQYKQ